MIKAAHLKKLGREITLPNKERRRAKIANYAAAMRAKTEQKVPLMQAAREKYRARLESGRQALQGIDSNGRPRFVEFYDVAAADGIKASPLWTDQTFIAEGVTGKNVPTVGLWDQGGVYKTHVEFEEERENPGDPITSRVSVLEDAVQLLLDEQLPISDHATRVAGALIANGDRADVRGVAFQAELKSFGSVNDFSEMLDELDEVDLKKRMTFSNHSYGEEAGWSSRTTEVNYVDNNGDEVIGDLHEWLGPVGITGEDPEFGAYTDSSQTLDSIVYHGATYLPVMAAGNNADLVGPYDTNVPQPEGRYVIEGDSGIAGVTLTSTVTRPTDAGPLMVGAENYPSEQNSSLVGAGLDTIASLGSSKNNLTVGAMEQNSLGVIYHSTFSSRGPTDDGRIKPDLMAIGTAFEAPNYDDDDADPNPYFTGSGTSYAAPCITGALALLQQLRSNFRSTPYLASTWKALLLNTATDITEAPSWIGDDAAAANLIGPDYFSGWGVANIEAAADLLVANELSGNRSTHLCEHVLYDQREIQIPIKVDDLTTELRAMICWNDPAYENETTDSSKDLIDPEIGPADNDTPRLVNDLDLRLIGPDGTEYFPWVPNPAEPFLAAGTGDNTRDNVEQIVLTLPAPGEYLLCIDHKGSLKASVEAAGGGFELQSGKDQAVSIVVSGNVDLDPALPRITSLAPNSSGTRMSLEVEGFIGVFYQVQESSDMITWTSISNTFSPLEIVTNPTTFLSSPIGNDAKRYFRMIPVNPHD